MPTVALTYFALFLIPNWIPKVGASAWFFVYLSSIVVVLAMLLILVAISGLGLLWSALRRRKPRHLARPMAMASLASLVTFGVVLLAARVISRDLPTGSNLLNFDGNVWRDPSSTAFAQGDATPRQKMLGDVVAHVLPGRHRVEIEALLGPSLDSPYFRESGRDLIYVLGPERDSFLRIDSEWLLIWLDESGRFKRYKVVTD